MKLGEKSKKIFITLLVVFVVFSYMNFNHIDAATGDYSIKVGQMTKKGDIYSFPELTVSGGTGNLKSVTIEFISEIASGDSFTINKVTENGFVKGGDQKTLYLNASNGVSASVLQTYLRSNLSLYLNPSSSIKRKIRISVSKEEVDTSRIVRYSEVTGHYYEYIPSASITFDNARDAARSRTYMGMTGYLVTITSEQENAFISTIVQEAAWLGGSCKMDVLNKMLGEMGKPQTFTTQGAWNNWGSTTDMSNAHGKYYWIDGPEKGELFWQQTAQQSGASQVLPGQTKIYAKWANGEPNDSGGSETCAHLLANGNWNDYAYNNTSIRGYIVEYGNQKPIIGGATPETPPTADDIDLGDGTVQELVVTLNNKVYDGQAVSPSVTYKAGGTATGVTITYQKKQTNGTYAAFSGTPYEVGDYLVLAKSSNKSVIAAEKEFSITKKALTVTSIQYPSKVYDGNTTKTSATMGTINFSGKIGSDNVVVTSTGGVYNSKDVNTATQITLNGLALTGTKSSNYSVDATKVVTGNITKKDVSIVPKVDPSTKKTGENMPTTSIVLASGQSLVSGEQLSVLGTPSFSIKSGSTNLSKDSAAGNYEVKITGMSGGSGNYNINYASTTTMTVTQDQAVRDTTYTVTGTLGQLKDGKQWYKGNVTIAPKSPYDRIWNGTSWVNNLTISQNGKQVTQKIKLLKNSTGAFTNEIDNDFAIDTVLPVVEGITWKKINSSQSSEFLNKITGGLFWKEAIEVEITANDTTSGVESITYKVGNGAETVVNTVNGKATISLPLSTSGSLSVKAKDVAGNESAYTEIINNVILENDVPEITVSQNVKENDNEISWYDTEQKVVISATDSKTPSSGFESFNVDVYSLQGSQYTKLDSLSSSIQANEKGLSTLQRSLSFTDAGLYKIVVNGQDRAGNQATEVVRYIAVDTVTPQLKVEAKYIGEENSYIDQDWSKTDIVYTLTNQKTNVSGVTYYVQQKQTDGAWGQWESLSGNQYVVDETKTVQFKVLSKANKENVSREYTTKIDKNAPDAITMTPNQLDWQRTATAIKVSAEDNQSGIAEYRYSLDNQITWSQWTSWASENQFTVNDDKDYSGSIVIEVKDKVGNIGQLVNGNLRIDKTLPSINGVRWKKINTDAYSQFLNKITGGLFWKEAVEVEITASDVTSGVESIAYKIGDTGVESSAIKTVDDKATFILPLSTSGKLLVKATDVAGNETVYQEMIDLVMLEDTPPEVTFSDNVVDSDENIKWNNTNQEVLISFKDAETGFKNISVDIYRYEGSSYVKIDNLSSQITNSEITQKALERKILFEETGLYKIVVNSQDRAENSSTEEVRYIAVDLTDPIFQSISTPSGWSSQHQVDISVKDEDSGLEKLYVIIDNEAPLLLSDFSKDVSLETGSYQYKIVREGTHEYQFQLYDNSGNKVESNKMTIQCDKTAPIFPTVTIHEPNGLEDNKKIWYKENVPSLQITPTANETDRSLNHSYYVLNNGSKVEFTSVTDLTAQLVQGENILRLYCEDEAGLKAINNEKEYLEFTYFVDSENPEIKEMKTTTLGDDIYSQILNKLTFDLFYKEKVKVDIHVNDQTSGIKTISYATYENDTAEDSYEPATWKTVDTNEKTSFYIEPDFKGYIYAKTMDKAGNESDLRKGGIIVENKAPQVEYRHSQMTEIKSQQFEKDEQTITISIDDQDQYSGLKDISIDVYKNSKDGYQKRDDLSLVQSYLSQDMTDHLLYEKTLTESGLYKFVVNVTDQSGNKTIDSIRYINIDNDKPKLSITNTTPSSWVTEHTVQLSLNDGNPYNSSGLSKLYIIKDRDDTAKTLLKDYEGENVYVTQYDYVVEDEGTHTYQFIILDKSGQETTIETSQIQLDKGEIPFPEMKVDEPNGDNDQTNTWYCESKPHVVIKPVQQINGISKRYSQVWINDHDMMQSIDDDVILDEFLVEGENTITLRTVNEAGVKSQGENGEYQKFKLYIDTKVADVSDIKIQNQELTMIQPLYMKETITFDITATDATSGVKSIAYAIREKQDLLSELTWIEEPVDEQNMIHFSIEKDGNYTIYAKAYDKAGNIAGKVISGKVVLDNQKPEIQEIDDQGIYYCDTEFKVNDEYLDYVTVDGQKTNQLILTASQDKSEEHQIEVHDLSGNILKYQVTMLPLSTLMEPFEKITVDNITENQLSLCQDVYEQFKALNISHATKEQKDIYENSVNRLETLIHQIENIQKTLEQAKQNIPQKDIIYTSISQNDRLIESQQIFKKLLEGENLTVEKRKDVQESLLDVENRLLRIEQLQNLVTLKTKIDDPITYNQNIIDEYLQKSKELLNIEIQSTENNVTIDNLELALSVNDIQNYQGEVIRIYVDTKKMSQDSYSDYEDYKHYQTYDIRIFKEIDSKTTEVNQFVVPLEISIDLPKEYQDVKEWALLRIHNGEKTLLQDIMPNDNQKIIVKSNLFSEYQLLYKQDTVITSDRYNYAFWIYVCVLSSGMIIFIYKKRKFNN